MSIQSSINQGLAVAGALYTQTPGYQAKVQEKKDLQEIERLKNAGNKINASFDKVIKEAEEADALPGVVEQLEKRNKEEIEPIHKKLVSMGDVSQLEQEGSMLFDQAEKAYLANLKAEQEKEFKIKQMNKVKNKRKNLLDLETSLGGTLKDLKLNPKQLAAVKAQLKENK